MRRIIPEGFSIGRKERQLPETKKSRRDSLLVENPFRSRIIK
jgi:hypothetical protein